VQGSQESDFLNLELLTAKAIAVGWRIKARNFLQGHLDFEMRS
jgi:hypothetical protein